MKKINYQDYETLSDYWKDAQGRVPVIMMARIQKIQNERGVDFRTAYRFLLEKDVIIEI